MQQAIEDVEAVVADFEGAGVQIGYEKHEFERPKDIFDVISTVASPVVGAISITAMPL